MLTSPIVAHRDAVAIERMRAHGRRLDAIILPRSRELLDRAGWAADRERLEEYIRALWPDAGADRQYTILRCALALQIEAAAAARAVEAEERARRTTEEARALAARVRELEAAQGSPAPARSHEPEPDPAPESGPWVDVRRGDRRIRVWAGRRGHWRLEVVGRKRIILGALWDLWP